jgi:proteasome inhibitor subunit 1 (PI31)
MTVDPVLDPSALLSRLPGYLPAAKTLKSSQDGIAALVHTTMSALDFRLIGIEEGSAGRDLPGNVLPDEWNAHGPGHYTLVYKHDQSSLSFVLHVSKLGSRTMINGIATQVWLPDSSICLMLIDSLKSDKAASMDVSTEDFTSSSFFPYDAGASNAAPLVHGFIASNRVTDFVSRYKLSMIQKLVPGLRKEGYTELPAEAGSSSSASRPPPRTGSPQPARPQPDVPPQGPDMRVPYSHIPPQNPLEIGRRDRDPFPSNPFAPPNLFPDAGGDGMFVGPNHPIFGGRGQGGANGPMGAPRGPWGGDGFLPPMGAPPGARFDPVGPFPGLRGPPGSPGGGGGGGMPGRGPRFGPDNDEFMPPGMVRASLVCLSPI